MKILSKYVKFCATPDHINHASSICLGCDKFISGAHRHCDVWPYVTLRTPNYVSASPGAIVYIILLNHYTCPFPVNGGHFFDKIFSFGKCNCQKLSITNRL